MKLLSSLCPLSYFLLFDTVSGLHFNVKGSRNPPELSLSRFGRRGNLDGSSPLSNSADITYTTPVTLGGQQFSVLIDTGSADLWVAGSVPSGKDTGKTSGVTYAIGEIKGPVKTADLNFAGYPVQDQAYIEVTPDAQNAAGSGLIGLGPNDGSNVYHALGGQNAGASVVDRIFLQNTSTPNYITVLLGRTEDPTDIFAGDITVSEVLSNYTDITNQPKVPVTRVPVKHSGDQHFQILIDADGIIGPDGKPISVNSEVGQTKNKKQATAVIDTGFSLSQVPKSVADDMYSRFAGAQYSNVQGVGNVWVVPCTLEVNVSFKIGGVSYPMHALDTTLDPTLLGLTGVEASDGTPLCIGTYQPMSFDNGDAPYDIILGMSFIRNVYVLFDYGDFIAGPENRGDPYLQLLSTTEPIEAHSDFVTVRLSGNDITGSQTLADAAPKSNNNSNSNDKKRNWIILAIGIGCAVLAVLVAITGIICFRRRRHSKTKHLGAYKALNDPNPHMGQTMNPTAMHYGGGGHHHSLSQQQLYDPQPGNYQNPWDHRH